MIQCGIRFTSEPAGGKFRCTKEFRHLGGHQYTSGTPIDSTGYVEAFRGLTQMLASDQKGFEVPTNDPLDRRTQYLLEWRKMFNVLAGRDEPSDEISQGQT